MYMPNYQQKVLLLSVKSNGLGASRNCRKMSLTDERYLTSVYCVCLETYMINET
jgi:hypothetical protein